MRLSRAMRCGWSFTLYRGADGKWVLEDGAIRLLSLQNPLHVSA